jgi:hypothetical protein
MVGALTSRPESLHKITRQQLQESIGFDLPVIARPENIVLERARDWKVLVLRELAAVSGKKIVMLDDQQGLIELIEKQNNPQVKGILMKGVWRGGREEMGVSWEQLVGRLQELRVSW